jgi:hypothetical protein
MKNDVPRQFQEIGIAINQNRLVALLKDVAHMSMVPIEALRVDSIQLPHTFGQIGIRRLNHKVIMVGHQAVGITHPPHAPTNVPEYQVNICPTITTRRDMIHCVWELYA